MLFQMFTLAAATLQVFSQTDYKITHERISVDYYNTEFFKNLTITLFHHTRYEKRFRGSVTVLHDLLGREFKNVVQAYKFQSMEYREFPVYFEGNACDIIEKDTFGTATVHYNSNIPNGCPFRKGFYYCSDCYVDDSKLPPYAPRGRYMLEFKTYYNNTILLGSAKWYGAIDPTNPLERVIVG